MKITTGQLNIGETFICSFKRAKEVFANTNVHLNFGSLGRSFVTFAHTQDAYYVARNIKGRVVASFYYGPTKDMEYILSIYPIKRDLCNDQLKQKFENELLPQMLQAYQEQLVDDPIIIRTYFFLVELRDGNLYLHKGRYN